MNNGRSTADFVYIEDASLTSSIYKHLVNFFFFVYKFESQVFVVRQKQNGSFRQPLIYAIHTKNVNFVSLFEVNLMWKQCGKLKTNAPVSLMNLLFLKSKVLVSLTYFYFC